MFYVEYPTGFGIGAVLGFVVSSNICFFNKSFLAHFKPNLPLDNKKYYEKGKDMLEKKPW